MPMDLKMETSDLGVLRVRFKGKPFYKLVEHHLKKQSQTERIQGIQGTIAMLPHQAQGIAEDFIDRWNQHAYDQSFWQQDTASVFEEIVNDARAVLSEATIPFDDETLFNMFNIVVVSYAYSAYDQPKIREFLGIKFFSFPWFSMISLLYPLGAAIYMVTQEPARPMMIVGYGLVNLGFLLFGAGILKGTFRVLGLTKRWHVLAGGAIALLIGIFLSKIEA
jgi:hypothetical protein